MKGLNNRQTRIQPNRWIEKLHTRKLKGNESKTLRASAIKGKDAHEANGG
jgi:hypothetical protein